MELVSLVNENKVLQKSTDLGKVQVGDDNLALRQEAERERKEVQTLKEALIGAKAENEKLKTENLSL